MNLLRELKKWLKNRRIVVVLGIGSSIRGDDAIGLEIVRRLKGKALPNVKLIECGTVPESFLGKTTRYKPTHVIMIDAARIGGEPGVARLVFPEEILGIAVSTHALPLSMMADYLKQSINAKVILLGIKPKSLEFGTGLSPVLRRAAEKMVEILEKVLSNVK